MRLNFEKLFYTTTPDWWARGKGKFMRKNSIYAIVLLSVFCLSFTAFPTGSSQTDASSDIKILNYNYYFDLQGYLVVVGEIQNTGSNVLNNIVIHGTVTPNDGTSPVETAGGAWVTYMIPQQKAPLYLVFYSSDNIDGTWSAGDVESINLEVVQAKVVTSYQYSDIKIATQTTSIGTGDEDKGVYWVHGTIENFGSQTAKNISVVATFYNASGAVVAAGHTYDETVIPNTLAPSKTATFEIAAYDLNMSLVPSRLQIDHYSLLLQVIEPLLQGDTPVITATPTPAPGASNTPTDTNTPTNTQNANTNPTDDSNTANAATPTWLYPAVIVIVIVAVIGAALAVMKRKPKSANKKIK